MSSTPTHYEICFISEIIAKSIFPSSTKNVRITGKLHDYSPITAVGTLSDFEKTSLRLLKIDFKNIIEAPLITGSYYQVSGVIQPGETLTITAEIVRNVDGIDLQMFKESIKLRRQFLSKNS